MDPLRTPGVEGAAPEGTSTEEVVTVPNDEDADVKVYPSTHVDVDASPLEASPPARQPEDQSGPQPAVGDPPSANCNGQQHGDCDRRISRPRPSRRRSSVDSIPPTAIAASPPAPPGPISVGLGLGDLDDLDFDPHHRTTLERRRQQTLLISILDLMIGLGLLTYHTDRIITFYRPTRSQLQLQRPSIDNTSPLVILLWTITFSIILLQLSTSVSLLSCSYSTHCTDLASGESSRSSRRANCWIICAQLLMTLWIAKLTVYTASFQYGYEIGVFNIVVEDYTSIWFVLLFYLGLVVFKGVGIFFVRKYVREL